MRLNQFIAGATGCSRRQADELIKGGGVVVNAKPGALGQIVNERDSISLDGQILSRRVHQYLLLNKPAGYVCSRAKQTKDPTVYDLLPPAYHHLKPVGRLDKDSSGLLLLTNDGAFAQELTHPKHQKDKTYRAFLESPLKPEDKDRIEHGIMLKDGQSRFQITEQDKSYIVKLSEGKNRQIRRTFGKLGYTVTGLQRMAFADYQLSDLAEGKYKEIKRT